MMRRTLPPLLAGLLGLAGALASALYLHRAASAAIDRTLEERLRGAGETTAAWLAGGADAAAALRAATGANALEGAYVVSPDLTVLADTAGPAGGRADLLRVDAGRVARAARGEPSVAFAWAVADAPVATGYFPVRGPDGAIRAVLALEAGQEFGAVRSRLTRALGVGVALALLAAAALFAAARAWATAEARARDAAARAARGDALVLMGAMVAHEIRNPLGVIRGAAELVTARSGGALAARDREALGDVLDEVERLRRLTDDFLDLSREPALVPARVDLAVLAAEVARAAGRAHPGVVVGVDVPALAAVADAGRIRQVLSNLVDNAAHAGATAVVVRGRAEAGEARIEVRDDGPGVDAAVAARLFEPFVSGRVRGAGLGLAIARRIAERHGGGLELVDPGPGAAFELRLPLAPGEPG
jgi:two-component system, OmpR family, sensor kinase